MRGQFIVLEGIDGSGTTSVSARVAGFLRDRGLDVHTTREPSGGEIGTLTRALLSKDATQDPRALALLFAADRLDHLVFDVEPALARGAVVICDRYLMSSWAYQSLECPLEWVRQINAEARWPDLTLLLDLPADVAWQRVMTRAARGDAARERFDELELQRRLAETYRRLAAEEAARNVSIVDAAAPLDDVVAAASARVAEHVDQSRIG